MIGQFISEMSGIEDLQGVVVLATTNRLDLIDPALLVAGRFDLVLELPLPDAAARESIFRIELRQKPLASDVDVKNLAAIGAIRRFSSRSRKAGTRKSSSAWRPRTRSRRCAR